MTRRTHHLALAVSAGLVFAALLAGPTVAADKRVTMVDMQFRPRIVTINAGDRVTWVNGDAVEHDADGSGWSTSLLGQGDSDSVRFNRAGMYRYVCSIHASMTGTVVVRAGVTPNTDSASTGAEPDDRWPTSALALVALLALELLGGTVLADRLLRRRSGSST
jgi:plastocyanin